MSETLMWLLQDHTLPSPIHHKKSGATSQWALKGVRRSIILGSFLDRPEHPDR